MKIIFIRHGNPNYKLDCLTELGHKQAETAAAELCKMGIQRIYSSPNGRAIETAQHTAEKISLEVNICEFIREINWAPKNPELPYSDGNPWERAFKYLSLGRSLSDNNWKESELFKDTFTPESFDALAAGLDEWLSSIGIKREGYYYRIDNPKYDTVAVFCHGGSFAATIAHMFNMPLPLTLLTIPFDQTGISVVEFKRNGDNLIAPRLCMAGNVKHLEEQGLRIT